MIYHNVHLMHMYFNINWTKIKYILGSYFPNQVKYSLVAIQLKESKCYWILQNCIEKSISY